MKNALLVLTLMIGTTVTAQAKVIDREAPAKTSKGSGTNIGGGNNGSEYLAIWGRGSISFLRNFKNKAALKLNNTGDYNVANKLLTDGIIQALENSANAKSTFLHKSLVRGLTISNHLGATLGGNTERKARAANYILDSYYDFMIEVVAENLDLNGKIPYMNSSDDQMDKAAARFEQNFVIYANTQLNWILNTLTSEVRIGDRVQVVPVGDINSVFKVALTLIAGTATDLEESLWNYRFSCSILDLQNLNDTLKAYDQGNKEMFEDEKQALAYTTSELRRISKTLVTKESCR